MYSVAVGDTFEIISRKKYGSETGAVTIAAANPGVFEPLTPGTSIIVPDATISSSLTKNGGADDQNEVAILIEGRRFRFWNSVRVTRSIDKMDTIEISAPFDHDEPLFRENFRPFSFAKIEVTVGGEALFSGTLVSVTPQLEPTTKTVTAGGYSLPGVLNDCTPPASALPLEFDGQDLEAIAKKIAEPFGLGVQFDAPAGAVFERVACEAGKKSLMFLSDLARERGLVISSTEQGKLLFRQSAAAGVSVAKLEQGKSPLLSVTPSFNPQEYYSHITGIEPVIIGLEGAQYTVKNDRLSGVIRPLTFTVNDAEGGDTQAAVSAKMGRMFANMASYSARVATWRDHTGELWQPNTTIKLAAPDAMIYNEYAFLIRSVSFERQSNSTIATLGLVLPGAFSGEIPEALPWD
jgi:prophage tail gpP-like protein/phage tail protein X